MMAQDDDDPRHDYVQFWETRHHIILEWDIEGIDFNKVTKDADTLKSMKLVNWLNQVTGKLIIEAQSFPNSPALSSDGTTPTAELETA